MQFRYTCVQVHFQFIEFYFCELNVDIWLMCCEPVPHENNRQKQNSVCHIYTMNKYVCPRNIRTAMYTGHITCCPLLSHVEYALTGQ